MKGKAIKVNWTSLGHGYRIGFISAKASVTGQVTGASDSAIPPMPVDGEYIREAGLRHYMTVTPTEPQQLVWLTPQVGIDYTVTTSTNLEWKIK